MSHSAIHTAIRAQNVRWSGRGQLVDIADPNAVESAVNNVQLNWMDANADGLGWTPAQVGAACRGFVDVDPASYNILLGG